MHPVCSQGSGFTSVVISAEMNLTIASNSSMFLRGLSQWRELWKGTMRTLDSKTIKSSGVERYSLEHACVVQRIIDVSTSGEAMPPYLRSAGHATVSEFHEFLVGYCQLPDQ